MANSLVVISSSLRNQGLMEYTLFNLLFEYDTFITTVTYFGRETNLEDLRGKLRMFEQRLL